MKISTMRKIDYYAGVPLTFIFSMVQRVKRSLSPHKKNFPSEVHSILLIELSEMGSMIQLMPMMAKMREIYPHAVIHFITFRSSAHILNVLKNVDEEKLWTLNTKNLFVFSLDVLRLVYKLVTTRFDITFDFELFSRTSALISYCSGATVKVGFDHYTGEGLYHGNFLTHPVTYNPHVTIAQNFFAMLYALEEPWNEIPHTKRTIRIEEIALPPFALPRQTIDELRVRLQNAFPQLAACTKLVLLNPNSSETLPLRRWPMDNYLKLAQLLSAVDGLAIAITGGPDERKDAAFICSGMPHIPIIDLSGYTTMEEVIALYHIADLMVTNDSGPAQFAALAKLPTITFFGPETPDLYGSLNPNGYNFYKRLHCSPCYTAQNNRTSLCTNNVCMQAITVDEVYSKAKEMLAIT